MWFAGSLSGQLRQLERFDGQPDAARGLRHGSVQGREGSADTAHDGQVKRIRRPDRHTVTHQPPSLIKIGRNELNPLNVAAEPLIECVLGGLLLLGAQRSKSPPYAECRGELGNRPIADDWRGAKRSGPNGYSFTVGIRHPHRNQHAGVEVAGQYR